MKYMGSPITTLQKLDKNTELGEDQAEISNELMEFSLEDQEEAKVRYCLISLQFPYAFILE